MTARDPWCSVCGRVHQSDDAYAVGRFGAGPVQYRGRFERAPLRATRAEAVDDLCQHFVWLDAQKAVRAPITCPVCRDTSHAVRDCVEPLCARCGPSPAPRDPHESTDATGSPMT